MKSLKIIMSLMWSLILIQYSEALKKGIKNKLYSRCLDLDAAIEGALIAKYRNAGQTCVCVNRFLVQEGIYEKFIAALSEKVNAFAIGNGLDVGSEIGPLINANAVKKVEAHVADALAKAGRLVAVVNVIVQVSYSMNLPLLLMSPLRWMWRHKKHLVHWLLYSSLKLNNKPLKWQMRRNLA